MDTLRDAFVMLVDNLPVVPNMIVSKPASTEFSHSAILPGIEWVCSDEEGEITCSVDAGDSNDGLTRSLGFNIENYTNGTYKNVKAVVSASLSLGTCA